MVDVLVLQIDGGKDTVSLDYEIWLMSVHHTTSQLSALYCRPTSHSAQQTS